MSSKRPAGLIAIILYKCFIAGLTFVTAIALLFTLKNHDQLADFADTYLLESKHQILNAIVDRLLNTSDGTLRLSGYGALAYSALTMVEAVGLWYQKLWAELLVIVLVAMSVPLELYELAKGFSVVKTITLIVNLAVLTYLIQQFRQQRQKHKAHSAIGAEKTPNDSELG